MNYSSRDLADLYDNVKGKIVSQRKHLNVLGEANISIEYSDGNVQQIELPDNQAKKILRLSKGEESTDIKKWIESAGWDTEAAQFALDSRLKSIYSSSIQLDNRGVLRKFYDEVKLLTYLKNAGNIKVLETALKDGSTNFKRHIEKLAASKSLKYITDSDAITKISNITFEEGSVGVGPGEAVITLFSEGKNPAEGDIVLPNGDLIELKAGAGRPGKGKTLSLIRNFNNFIKSNQLTTSLDEDQVNKVLSAITNFDFSTISAPQQRVVDRVINNIDSIDDIEVKVKAVYKDTKNKPYFNNIKTVDNQTSINDYLKIFVDQIKERNEKEGASSNRFFSSASEAELLGGLRLFSSEADIASPIIENAISQNRNLDQGKVSRAIAAAIQIVEYHKEEGQQGFTYFTLFNKDNFNMLTLGPFTASYKENIERTINDMINSSNDISISPNTGGGRGGYNLTLR